MKLHRITGWTEVAAAMGLSVSTLRSRMSDLPDNYPVSIDPSSSRPQALLEDIYEYTRNPKTPRYKSQTGDEGEE